MSAWNYEYLARPFATGLTSAVMERRTCMYCRCLVSPAMPALYQLERTGGAHVRVCSICGWWCVLEQNDSFDHTKEFGGFASLKNLDLTDLAVPVGEVKQYLLAKYEARSSIHPRLFEETVSAVFSGLGYATRVTAYGGDNGIDIYLDGPDDTLVGIQVKRWKRSIEIDQIHSLCGALQHNGCTKGVFVTTSSFQRGAIRAAATLGAITGIPMELIDAKGFYDALRITTRPIDWHPESPDAPWNALERPYLWTDV